MVLLAIFVCLLIANSSSEYATKTRVSEEPIIENLKNSIDISSSNRTDVNSKDIFQKILPTDTLIPLIAFGPFKTTYEKLWKNPDEHQNFHPKPPKRHEHKKPSRHKKPPKKSNRETKFEDKLDSVKNKAAKKLFFRNRKLKNKVKELKNEITKLKKNQMLTDVGTPLISSITSTPQQTTVNLSSLTFFTTDSTASISDIPAPINETHSAIEVAVTGLSNHIGVSRTQNDQLIIGLSTGFVVLCALAIILVIIGIRFYKRNEKGK